MLTSKGRRVGEVTTCLLQSMGHTLCRFPLDAIVTNNSGISNESIEITDLPVYPDQPSSVIELPSFRIFVSGTDIDPGTRILRVSESVLRWEVQSTLVREIFWCDKAGDNRWLIFGSSTAEYQYVLLRFDT